MSTAIITGGAVRLGRAMAIHLAKRGENIALIYNTSTGDAEQCIREIKGYGAKCNGYSYDLNQIDGLSFFFESLCKDITDISLLINSASIFPAGTVEKTSLEQLTQTININLIAPFILMREYKRYVGKGLIINILDQRISKNYPSHAAYSVSKVGLSHLTTLAAVEFGSTVRVNGMAPGLILPQKNRDESYFEKKGRTIPVKKSGNVAALLKGVDYLIDNPFVNGETLFIDGGESKV